MRIVLLLISLAAAAVAGFFSYPNSITNNLLTIMVVYLLFEVFLLRRRMTHLEEQVHATASLATSPRSTTTAVDPPIQNAEPVHVPSPVAAPSRYTVASPTECVAPSRPAPPHPPTEPSPLQRLFTSALGWITGGNPVLKIGLVVLFFGVAFLLKYAAQRNMLPLELRMGGAALGGIGLLVLGWRLRRTHPGYGLGLEGGGIGILYLVVFAAAKLYGMLPMPLALGIMVGLVAFSGLLAVLQDAKGLAIFGSAGGFLAPVLMSTGSGSHVLLFSYYALLNSGLLGIAWFKAWRELNLVGFVFTFGLVSLWGISAYTPAHFATTEPFLLLFFVMYCTIAVLFAHRQPLQLRGFIDGPLVFGLPIVASSLQAYLVQDFRYGMALSALGLGSWYIGLARLLWNRFSDGMRLLCEAFLALGVVFASLAIPLGLDPHWTTAAWALEGAAMIWVGVRQQRTGARIFGLLLQLGAVLAFFDHNSWELNSLPLANRVFLSTALIGIAGLFSSYWFDRLGDQTRRWEPRLPQILMAWGLTWWYVGGFIDLHEHRHLLQPQPAFLLYACVSTAIFSWISQRFVWSRLHRSLLLLLPIMILVYIGQLCDGELLLSHLGWLAWPLAFAVQYRLLYRCESQWSQRIRNLSHCLSLWLLLLVLTSEISWRVEEMPELAETWSLALWGLVPLVLLTLLGSQGHRSSWPVARHETLYHGIATDIPVLTLLGWGLASLGSSGDPHPLPYIPLLNPLELIELAILLLSALRWQRGRMAWPVKGQALLIGLPAFLWLNAIVARTVHFYSGTYYAMDALFGSPIFQAAIAALWSLLALSLTVIGARRGQRPLWFTGAGLLALVVLKLFVIDLSGTGSIGRIISFLVVGLLMLVIGFFAPLPPQSTDESSHVS